MSLVIRRELHMSRLTGLAESLARDLLFGLPRRWLHVSAAALRARSASAILSDHEAECLEAAAWLHDIGYSELVAETGCHSIDGAAHLSRIQIPYRVCALVANHSCAWREVELRGLSSRLDAWKDELTVVRDALWWADMTTGPDGDAVEVHERIAEIQARYGPEDLVTFFIRQAEPDLVGAVERTEARLKAAGVEFR
ncbi:HD domain-containing protein [Saccharothrix saharensis]|uniref:HD domain-containing protein n=1 Tax=Saccharothrix saharensis TaxID=571190 RepID=UPI0036CDF1C1